MSLKDFLTSKVFFKHLAMAVALILVLILFTLQMLKFYTLQRQSYEVPDFRGMQPYEAEKLADDNNLKFKIADSLHLNGAEPGAVVEQVPEPGLKVKKNRIISVIINSTVPEKVILPKIADVSFRQAQAMIENCGLVTGNITFEASEYNELVLKVMQRSRILNQGDEVLKGSTVDLVIGRSGGGTETTLPDLTGLSITEAKNTLSSGMLNAGVLIYDSSILTPEDSANAIVWKQYPSTSNTRIINVGGSVDLWLTSIDTTNTAAPETPEIEQ